LEGPVGLAWTQHGKCGKKAVKNRKTKKSVRDKGGGVASKGGIQS